MGGEIFQTHPQGPQGQPNLLSVSWWVVDVVDHSHLALGSSMGRTIPLHLLTACLACYGRAFTLPPPDGPFLSFSLHLSLSISFLNKMQSIRTLLLLEVSLLGLLDAKDEGTTVLRNVGNCLPVETVKYRRRLESSRTQPWEPQIFHKYCLTNFAIKRTFKCDFSPSQPQINNVL